MHGGVKYDQGKPALELLPPSYWSLVYSKYSWLLALWYYYNEWPSELILDYDPIPVLVFGKEKYGAFNWFKGMRWGRLVGAFHRHCNVLVDGVWRPRDLCEVDDETGLMHGQHAECCRLFLAEYRCRNLGDNDCPWAQG